MLFHRDAESKEVCTSLHLGEKAALRAWLQQFRDAIGDPQRRGYTVRVHDANLKRTICQEYGAYEMRKKIYDCSREAGLSPIRCSASLS